MELLLRGRSKQDFMGHKKTTTKDLVASDSTASTATSWGIIEDSFEDDVEQVQESGHQELCSKVSSTSFWQNLHKPKEGGLPGYVQGDSMKSVTIWSTSCDWTWISLSPKET